jgi:trimethylamine:corrinoid methyltransferase-like protein
VDRIAFGLSGGLSKAQIEDVHKAVLAILKETGVACEHAPTAEAVAAVAGVKFESGRLKFSAEVVEAAIERARTAGRKRRPEARVRVTAPWTCFNIIDMETDAIRPSTAEDAVAMLKLAASFNDEGPPPVYPCDLDERIQVLWLEKACLEQTQGIGGAMVTHDPETIRWLGELHAAAGRRYPLSLQFVISPLRLDHLALELFWRFKEDPLIDVVPSICPIPVGGMTAPLFASGLLAQSIAESLGGMIVVDRLELIGPDVLLPVRVDHGDMRDLTVAYSLPENVMIQVLLRDLAEHFGGYRLDFIYLNTNAKRPDGFAAADRIAYMLMLGLAGFRHFFMGAGQMSMDEIFSPAQFIIDMEMGRYVQQVLDGMAWHGDVSSITATVAEGVQEGNFLAHSTTLDALRGFFDSKLFRRSNVGQWRAAGEPRIEQSGLEIAKEAITSYQFQREPEEQAELDRVFGEACRMLGVDVATQPIPRR